ncbi:carbohydrate ABC transporter permease [Spirochaeta africana]|uniref:Permease component of ABC-type sugar transporter n=1 Tax=Spirochaeta africana (strain ATCC 700263 / DSM 8902 / Z-7692) TaxID=889378 RepID=H9UM03_SPIAZ|nr:sugar ABC transporter permease [Spirochaeta africana]AFG38546.1 permease component of ABC-type sugar transporter [Spirochaeta africana DSM 8902]
MDALSRQRRFAQLQAMLLVLPAMAAVGMFLYYPLVLNSVYSMFEMEFTTSIAAERFVGLQQYLQAVTNPQLLRVILFTLGFSLVVVILDLTLGMLLALASFAVPPKTRWLLRSMIVIPWAIPPVIQAAMWRWLLNSDVGPVADLLVRSGLVAEAPLFLARPWPAMVSLATAFSWKGASITAFFFMGGLAMIPQEYREAARIDGAGPLHRFFRITLPLLLPVVFVALLYRGQDAVRVFDLVYGMTGGGPGTATDTLSSFAYAAYFRYSRYGQASAYAVLTFLLVALPGVLLIRRAVDRFAFRRTA